MISKTSCRKWVVFSGAIKRFKWLSILYGVTLFLELPLLIWLQLSKLRALQGNQWAEVANNNFPHVLFNPVEHLMNIVVAVIFGLILFNYLQKDRASTFFHSLPIKRVSLYCQNLLAGLTLIWLPILVNGLLIYGVLALFGITEGRWQDPYAYSQGMEMVKNSFITVPLWKVVGYWLGLSLLMTGFFYIFTVFIGMLTGNVLLQGALTFIGLFLPLGLFVLIQFNLWKLLYGFSRDIDGNTVEWLSPIVSYISEQNFRLLFSGSTWYSWYFVIALILCGLSIYLYNKRHVEAAGETLAAEWMRRVFKYGVAVCTALTGGLYLGSIYENSVGVLYLGYFIGAVLGYIIADMIAYKSFHFYKRWKGMVAFGAVFIVLLTTINLDFYGYERYVPEQQKVKEVFLNNLNRDGRPSPQGLTSEDNIRRVREFHRQIIKLEEENKAQERAMYNRQKTVANPMAPPSMVMPMDITYVFENGRKVKRSYRIDIYRYREFLYPIINTQEAKKSMFGRLFKLEEDKVDQINVNNHRFAKSVRIYKRAEISEALAALRKDVLAISYEAAMEGKVPSQANIEFVSKDDQKNNFISTNLEYYSEFKNFEGFLKKHGYLKEIVFDPGDVSALIIKQTGSDKTLEVRDKDEIKALLSWARLEDANAYTMRQRQPGNSQYIEYYGKVVKEKGSPIYVSFDSSPYPQQLIYKLLNKK